MKTDLELDRISARIHFLYRTGEAAEAREHLRRLVSYELADALDEIERRSDAKDFNTHHIALKEFRARLGLERIACSPKG